MSQIVNHSRLIIALDFDKTSTALEFIKKIDPSQCRLKIGKELFTRGGPLIVEKIHQAGFDIFLDLKFHDIPTTAAKACLAAADLGVWMLNVHALGGVEMMRAARDAIEKTQTKKPLIIAVTILTSHTPESVAQVGLTGNIMDNVQSLATLAQSSGLDGVVCSAQEASRLRNSLKKPFILVTPGIRPSESSLDDQKRVMTPASAIAAGSDYLVVGRPITLAIDPQAVVAAINQEIIASLA